MIRSHLRDLVRETVQQDVGVRRACVVMLDQNEDLGTDAAGEMDLLPPMVCLAACSQEGDTDKEGLRVWPIFPDSHLAGCSTLWPIEFVLPTTNSVSICSIPGTNDVVIGTVSGVLMRLRVSALALLQLIRGKTVPKIEPTFTWAQEHTKSVEFVCVDDGGELICSASDDQSLKIWGVRAGPHSLGTCIGHTNDVLGCVFSKDGKFMVSAGADKTARVWGAEPDQPNFCQEIRQFERHKGWVWGVSSGEFNGLQAIATCSADKTVKVWSPETLELIFNFEHSLQVDGVAFIQNMPLVLSCCRDNLVRVWDLTKEECIQELQGHSKDVNMVHVVQFLVVTGSDDGTVKAGVIDALGNITKSARKR